MMKNVTVKYCISGVPLRGDWGSFSPVTAIYCLELVLRMGGIGALLGGKKFLTIKIQNNFKINVKLKSQYYEKFSDYITVTVWLLYSQNVII